MYNCQPVDHINLWDKKMYVANKLYLKRIINITKVVFWPEGFIFYRVAT